MNEKVINELIKFNEDWIKSLKNDLNNPVQKLIGTDSIIVKIIELETEVKILKDKLLSGDLNAL